MESQNPNPLTTTPKNSPLPLILLSILLVLSLSSTAFLFYQNQQLQTQITFMSKPETIEVIIPSISPDPTGDWKTYTDSQNGFSFKYPNSVFHYVDTNNNQVYMATQEGLGAAKGSPMGLSKQDIWLSIAVSKVMPGQIEQVKKYSESNFPQEVSSYTTIYIQNTQAIKIDFSSFSSETIKAFESTIDQILATVKFTTNSPTQSQIQTSTTYFPGKDWKTVTNPTLGLTMCLPPKWDYQQNGDGSLSPNLIYYRDTAYAPNVTYIRSIPYTSGSRREAYNQFWKEEYPNVRDRVIFQEISINGNTAILVTPKDTQETKPSPEGLALIWYANGKLWDASLSSWSYINNSKSAFLTDFYTAVSCSF
jgi:hypothetical protein